MDVDETPQTPSRKRSRASSQPSTPTRKQRMSDRFIPTRVPGADYDTSYALIDDNRENGKPQSDAKFDAFELALRNELVGLSLSASKAASANIWLDDKLRSSSQPANLFKYQGEEVTTPSKSKSWAAPNVSTATQQLLCSPRKTPRKIPKVPFKVLDAPDLQDDFYLNLVDWSQQNVLTVGLGKSVYLWSACTSQVTNLCDLSSENDEVSSVCWMGKGQHLAVGTAKGLVQIWDAQACRRVRTMPGHTHRVGTLASKTFVLASGSRDRKILMRDVRVKDPYVGELMGHKQEVCGLKWSSDNQYLASGGNDNKLLVWDPSQTKAGPLIKFSEHQAAVKAIAWSPHQHGLLASGGGTADRCIRFWNTTTAQPLQCVDTGSQVCNLAWSKTSNELVSTHGYSQHQIVVWKYPTMVPIATLTGHTYRVLYLAMSPDGETIVTGAGDETLRFWTVFNKSRAGLAAQPRSALAPFAQIR